MSVRMTRLIWTVAVGLSVLFVAAPVLIVILGSFTTEQYLTLPTSGLSLQYYWALGRHPEIWDSFLKSLQIGLASASVAMVLGVLLALGLNARVTGRQSRITHAITVLALSPLMVPMIIISMAMLQFFNVQSVTSAPVMLTAAHAVVTMPYVVRTVTASLTLMERNIEWAAANLGAGPWRTIWHAVVPNIRGGVAAGGVFAFLVSFDTVTLSLFLTSPTYVLLPVQLYNFVENAIDPIVASLSTLLIMFSVAIVYIAERAFGLRRILGAPI